MSPRRRWRQSVGDNTTNDYTWDESYTLPENLYLAWERGAGERYRKLASRFLLDETYFDPLSENKNVLAEPSRLQLLQCAEFGDAGVSC